MRTKTFEFEDIVENPKDYGLPTLQEFAKNPDKYRKREDHQLIQADRGSMNLGNYVQKHWYVWNGYETTSQNEIDKIIRNEGHSWKDLELWPELIPGVGRKCDIKIHVLTKEEYKRRENAIRAQAARKIIQS